MTVKNIFTFVSVIICAATLHAQTWTGIGNSAMMLNIAVRAMTVDPATNALYVGGSSGVMKYDGSTWSYLSGITGSVSALAIYNGELYAGGNMPTGSGIVKWDGSSWTPVGGGATGTVNALAVYNNKLVVAGAFIMTGSVMTFGLASWDGSVWTTFGGVGYGYNPSGSGINCMPVINGTLYAGGIFGPSLPLSISTYEGIWQYTGSTWVGASAGAGTGLQAVYSMVENNGVLYTAGSFTGAGNRVAQFTGSAWVPMGNGLDSTVFALVSYNNQLYAGGEFTDSGTTPLNYIARWNGTSWEDVGGGMGQPTAQPYVFALTTYNNSLVAGGQFTRAGGTLLPDVAQWSNGTGLHDAVAAMPRDRVTLNSRPDAVIITVPEKIQSLGYTVKIFNVSGREVQKLENLSTGHVEISRRALTNGIYFFRVESRGHMEWTGKTVLF